MARPRSADKEVRILLAAVDVFSREGYHRATVADVARVAGVAAGTIYLYFRRKEDLLVALVERFMATHLADARTALFAVRVGAPRLRKLAALHLEFFAENTELARVFQVHAREVDPLIRRGIDAAVAPYLALIERVIEEGKEAGHFDPGLDTTAARQLVYGALDAAATEWVLADTERASGSEAIGPRTERLTGMLTRALEPG